MRNPDHIAIAGVIHGLSWIAQFLGHGLAEGRAPALKDNFIAGAFVNVNFPSLINLVHQCLLSSLAVVLAPFFVHLEVLFYLGYRPAMRKRITNEIGKQVAKIRRQQGDQKRAADKKS